MTLLQLVNKIQIRLREDTTAAYNTNAYSLFITEMINEVKREVEDAWDWTSLRDQFTIATVASTAKYYIANTGKRARVLDAPEVKSAAVYNTTDNHNLFPVSSQWIRRIQGTSNAQEGTPSYYAFEGTDSSNDLGVLLYSTPDAVATIEFNMVVPQDDLAADATELTVPDYPVLIGAWARCISERGEDGGSSFSEIDAKYKAALSDAIAQDVGRTNHETTWYVE